MSIEELQVRFPPPERRGSNATPQAWEAVHQELQISFPTNFYEYAAVYGEGGWFGDEYTSLSIPCPTARQYTDVVMSECRRFRDALQLSRGFPYPVFPEKDGIFPIGSDEHDVLVCWHMQGVPDDWPILVIWAWREDSFREFECSLTEFLLQVISQGITLPCWPDPCWNDNVRFCTE